MPKGIKKLRLPEQAILSAIRSRLKSLIFKPETGMGRSSHLRSVLSLSVSDMQPCARFEIQPAEIDCAQWGSIRAQPAFNHPHLARPQRRAIPSVFAADSPRARPFRLLPALQSHGLSRLSLHLPD